MDEQLDKLDETDLEIFKFKLVWEDFTNLFRAN